MKKTLLLLVLFVASLIVYYSTSAGNTPYNYFVHLADAFLHGRYWLTSAPPWLNELIPAGPHRFYVPYPPLPALLLTPFVLIFGPTFPQQFLAHLLGAGTVVLTYLLALTLSKNTRLALYSALLLGFGSISWFLSSSGSAWYLSQVSSTFFLTAALLAACHSQSLILTSTFLGAAYLSRLTTILSLPLFLFLLQKKLRSPLNLLLFSLPLIICLGLNFSYNFLRFHTFLDKAYTLIPGVLSEPWYQKGIFHPSYLPRHLRVLFWSLPKFSRQFPYLLPSWSGLALWITTPAFIYAFRSPPNKRLTQITWLSIALISIPILSHGTTGFAQFGYRFAVDFYPLLLLLTIKGIMRSGLRWHHWLLLTLSIIVNLWGVLWINLFGWINF